MIKKLLGSHGLNKNQAGFTIIELLIATLVFSVILLIATFAIIQISRTYIKGYIGSETQNVNRSVIDEITQAIQESAQKTVIIPVNSPNGGGVYWFCVNNIRYTYEYNFELGDSGSPKDIFVKDNDVTGSCSSPASLNAPAAGATELLSQHMQLVPNSGAPILSAVAGSDTLFKVTMTVLYGDWGTYTTTTGARHTPVVGCVDILEGGAFCSESTITTTVQQRTS